MIMNCKGCRIKYVFLQKVFLKISQNSEVNTCVAVSRSTPETCNFVAIIIIVIIIIIIIINLFSLYKFTMVLMLMRKNKIS